MIDGKKVLALIPARGGSKGVPHKNIRLLAGKPLIAWTIEAAQRSLLLDRVILSSEDKEIVRISQECGCDVPFIRPASLATDEATTIETAYHALESLPERYDYLILLQPTSPFRHTEDIDNCIRLCHSHDANSCASVCEPSKSPYWMFTLDQEGFLVSLFPSARAGNNRRQQLPKTYLPNGAVYVAKTDWLKKNATFITHETLAYIMPQERSLDIDTELDFGIAEYLATTRL